jgi:hypothetical protein
MNDPSAQWYFGSGGQQHGPVTTDAIKQMLREGKISTADLVWSEGMSDWRVIAGLPEFTTPSSPAVPALTPPAAVPQYAAQPYPAQYGAQPLGYRTTAFTGESYNGLAIAGFVLSFLMPLVGLIISIVALSSMKKSGNLEGHGLAKAGLIISISWFVLGFLFFCLWSTLAVGLISASRGH